MSSTRRFACLGLASLILVGCASEQARVPSQPVDGGSEGEIARGLASWYGNGFHGRRTASGERFDMHALTAAHPSLPFGTRLMVRNPNNGREVVVRVNDRGPVSGARIIDLSRAAAEALDMVDSGVRRVQLWKLDAEETCDDRLDVLAAAAEAG